MRQMMLADNDFDIDAHVAGAANNLHHASRGRNAALRITRQLDIYNCTFELGQTQAMACAGRLSGIERELARKFRSQFRAWWNDDFVSDANVVGKDRVRVRAVTEQPNNGGMRTADDFFDAALESPVGMP